jgi:fibronectin type 3 domain-containing protein
MVVSETCTSDGYTVYKCNGCDERKTDDIKNATGHTSGDWIVDKAASTTQAGERHKECTICGTTLETGTVLYTPNITSAVNTVTGITLKWSQSGETSGYYVYRRKSGETWKRIATIKGETNLTYSDTTAVSGTTYAYTVKAYKGSVYSSYNTKGKGIVRLTMPAISTPVNTATGVKISWKAVSGAKGYYVYRRVSGSSWTRVGTVTSATQLYFVDKTAASGKVYAYTVRAYYNSAILSPYNTTGKGAYYLAQPTPKAVATKGRVTVTWSKSTGAGGYYVYRRTTTGGWVRVGTTTGTSYVDTTAKAGVRYYYTVRAYKGSYTSTYHPTGYVVIAK